MVDLLAAESSNDLIKVVPGLMIWTLIAFAITFFVLKKFAFGPIQKTIDDRRDRIRQAVDEADNARNEARELLEQNRAILGQARSESADILAEARKVADAQIDRAKQEAETERQRRLEDTRKQIEAETTRAIGQIRSEVADLTIEATERVVGKVLDAEDQRRLVQEAVQGLGLPQPLYVLVEEAGPEHSKTFTVEARLHPRESRAPEFVGRAQGSTKKTAEQDAARQLLTYLASRSKDADGKTTRSAQAEDK
jgi:F-type H+-transporting ATPase subunit b